MQVKLSTKLHRLAKVCEALSWHTLANLIFDSRSLELALSKFKSRLNKAIVLSLFSQFILVTFCRLLEIDSKLVLDCVKNSRSCLKYTLRFLEHKYYWGGLKSPKMCLEICTLVFFVESKCGQYLCLQFRSWYSKLRVQQEFDNEIGRWAWLVCDWSIVNTCL